MNPHAFDVIHEWVHENFNTNKRSKSEWIELFRTTPGIPQFEDNLYVYRGTSMTEFYNGDFGMTWTPSIHIAMDYAFMSRGTHVSSGSQHGLTDLPLSSNLPGLGGRPNTRVILMTRISPREALADLRRTGPALNDDEIIVDPGLLKDVSIAMEL